MAVGEAGICDVSAIWACGYALERGVQEVAWGTTLAPSIRLAESTVLYTILAVVRSRVEIRSLSAVLDARCSNKSVACFAGLAGITVGASQTLGRTRITISAVIVAEGIGP